MNINQILSALYIHIPYCASRCGYCAFYSSTFEGNRKDYIEALCREMDLRKEYLKGESVRTIYLGGGTPSQLTIGELEAILNHARSVFDCSSVEELTVEVNPDDVTDEYVQGLRSLSVNRVSIGIQSFHDDELKTINRRHSAAQAIEAVACIKRNGITNVSIDLMYGLPGQTLDLWRDNLQQTIQMEVPHVSAYSLTYEEGTRLTRLVSGGELKPVDEDTCADMFSLLREQLSAAGYVQYEISNFAKPGMESKHNSSYWNETLYIGLGASAHSFKRDSRQWNISNTRVYIEKVLSGANDFFEVEHLDLDTRYNDYVMTTLRTRKGMDLAHLKSAFGETLYSYCMENAKSFLSNGLLEIEADTLRLTEKGIFVSDGIMSELMKV